MSYIASPAMPQVAALRAARHLLTAMRSSPTSVDRRFIALKPFSAPFSTAVYPASPSTPSHSHMPLPPPSPSLSFSSPRHSPVPPPSQPEGGVMDSIASFLLPLFRPFRHLLGLDTLAISDALYRRAVASSTPALLSSYSLARSPLTGLSPLTTLHLFLFHSALSRLSLADPMSTYPTLLRATLEAWWADLSPAIISAVGALRGSAALREEQQRLMGFFRALDLALKVEGDDGRALVRSVLHHNLYGELGGEVHRVAEVVELEGWLRGNWERAQRVEAGDKEGKEEWAVLLAGGLPFHFERLPLLQQAGDEKTAEDEVRLVQYRVEVVDSKERIVILPPTQLDEKPL